MTKVFVTGGTGFIGQHLIRALIGKGYNVTALIRNKNLSVVVESIGASVITGDITNVKTLQQLPRFDCAFHIAGSMDHTQGSDALYEVNVKGTKNIVHALQKTGTSRFIHLSSLAVIADGSIIKDADENLPLPEKNIGIYATTKAIAEKEVLNAATDSFEVIIVRPPFVWGNGDRYSLPKLCEYVQRNYFCWIDKGDYPFSTCHVENLVTGLIAAAEKGRNRQIYFIKDKEEVTLRDFLSALLATQGLKEPKKNVPRRLVTAMCALIEFPWKVLPLKSRPPAHLRETVVMMGQAFAICSDKAEKELDFIPPISMEEGMKKMKE